MSGPSGRRCGRCPFQRRSRLPDGGEDADPSAAAPAGVEQAGRTPAERWVAMETSQVLQKPSQRNRADGDRHVVKFVEPTGGIASEHLLAGSCSSPSVPTRRRPPQSYLPSRTPRTPHGNPGRPIPEITRLLPSPRRQGLDPGGGHPGVADRPWLARPDVPSPGPPDRTDQASLPPSKPTVDVAALPTNKNPAFSRPFPPPSATPPGPPTRSPANPQPR